MKYIPILFSSPMVVANQEGTKTMTRRIFNPQQQEGYTPKILVGHVNDYFVEVRKDRVFVETKSRPMKYGQKGDILWVRERTYNDADFAETPIFIYRADNPDWQMCSGGKWKPSIFMPKEACRLFLKVISVKVERLHDISTADIEAEGVSYPGYFVLGKENNALSFLPKHVNLKDRPPTHDETMFALWAELWCKIRESWDSNPWVWVIEYEKTNKPVNWPN